MSAPPGGDDPATLEELGWSASFAEAFDALGVEELEPGRVALASGSNYRVCCAGGERTADRAGRFRHEASSAAELPAVGDWVAVRSGGSDPTRIEYVLPRRSALSRKTAGRKSEEQIVAANVDLVIAVMGLDGDFNLRRLERFLTAIWDSGARPAVVLNKLDLGDEARERAKTVEAVALGVPVLQTSCKSGEGIDEVAGLIVARETSVLVGSSGVGKSTMINRLVGQDVQKTAAVREEDDRGRHTTTHRELFRLENCGMIIDSPGIRELQLWADEESLSRAFDDIAGLAGSCRFRDCTHVGEDGCAVLEAVESGSLDRSRIENYHELQKEVRYLEKRRSQSSQRIEKSKWRVIHREMRRSGKNRRGGR